MMFPLLETVHTSTYKLQRRWEEKNMFDFIGLKTIGKRQLIVWASFVIFSVGGQIISIVISEGIIP